MGKKKKKKKKNTKRLPRKLSQVRSGTLAHTLGTRHKRRSNELMFFMPCQEGTLVSRERFKGEPMTSRGSSRLFVPVCVVQEIPEGVV